MKISRRFTRCLLRPADTPPSENWLKVVGVFNPGVAATKDGIVLLVRIAEVPIEERSGWVGLPRWDFNARKLACDWVKEEDVSREDTRSVRFRNTGLVRLPFVAHLRVMPSRDGKAIDRIESHGLFAESELEEFGTEDPRITQIGDIFYITYVAISRHGPATALASTRDFRSFQRHGVIFCPDNKDVVLFPERIGGRYYAIHRPSLSASLTRPEMWMASSDDLIHWGQHRMLYGGLQDWEKGRVGAGAPPFRTAPRWLEMIHPNDRGYGENRVGQYSGGLMLLDINEPWKVRKVSGAIFVPEEAFEWDGF